MVSPPRIVYFFVLSRLWRRIFPPLGQTDLQQIYPKSDRLLGKDYTGIGRIYLDLYQVFAERGFRISDRAKLHIGYSSSG